LLLAIAFIALCSQNSVFASENRDVRVSQVFQFWDKYITLPAQVRDGFTLYYTLRSRGGALPELYLVHRGQRTRIQTDRNGVVLNPPDLDAFRHGTIEAPQTGSSPAKTKGLGLTVSLDISPIIPLSRNIPIGSISNAINDYRDGIRMAGGPAAALAPRFRSIKFMGAQSGEVNFPNGRKMPLVMQDGGLVFTPSSANSRGAVNLVFNTAPNKAEYAK